MKSKMSAGIGIEESIADHSTVCRVSCIAKLVVGFIVVIKLERYFLEYFSIPIINKTNMYFLNRKVPLIFY